MRSLITPLLSSPLVVFASGNIGTACQPSAIQGGNLFGLVPWYYYLPASDFDHCSIRSFHFLGSNSDFPLILLAVVDDLLRIAGLVAIGFVIVGAIRYITSQGNAETAARAQETIINALIGVALATVAVGIVSFIGARLGR